MAYKALGSLFSLSERMTLTLSGGLHFSLQRVLQGPL